MPSCYERGIFAELFYWRGFLRITRKREWLRAPLTFVTMDVKNKPEKNQPKFDNLAKPETVTGPRITGCTNNSPSGFNARKVVSSSCWGLGPMHVVDFGKKISTVSNRINLLSFEWDVSPSFSSCRLSHAFRWDTYTVQSLVKYISENNTTRPSEWYLGPRDRPKGARLANVWKGHLLSRSVYILSCFVIIWTWHEVQLAASREQMTIQILGLSIPTKSSNECQLKPWATTVTFNII